MVLKIFDLLQPAHVKACFLGSSLSIPITDGKLALGTWQGIWLGEHRDHAGSRKLVVTLTGVLRDSARSPLSPVSPIASTSSQDHSHPRRRGKRQPRASISSNSSQQPLQSLVNLEKYNSLRKSEPDTSRTYSSPGESQCQQQSIKSLRCSRRSSRSGHTRVAHHSRLVCVRVCASKLYPCLRCHSARISFPV